MPGSSNPSRSAPSIIASAIRSFIEPVGLTYSSFSQTFERRRTSGVFPIVSRIVGTHRQLSPIEVPAEAVERPVPAVLVHARDLLVAEARVDERDERAVAVLGEVDLDERVRT